MVYIIAELGNTHEGSVDVTPKSMMSAAKTAGVDAVKVQTHLFDSESLEDAPNPPYFDGGRVVLILKGRVLAEMSISNFHLLLK